MIKKGINIVLLLCLVVAVFFQSEKSRFYSEEYGRNQFFLRGKKENLLENKI